MKCTLQHRNWISKVRLPAGSGALALASVLVLALVTTQPAQAQTFNTLYDFCPQGTGSSPVCTDGDTPYGTLVQGTDGNLYGTTSYGGANSGADCWDPGIGCGTFFRITPDGTLTTLYSFCSQTGCRDGSDPFGALVLGTDGNFYGTTFSGGGGCGTQYGCGTFFKVTPSGTLTMLVAFIGDNGAGPVGGLVLGTDGNFYGTTEGYAAGRRISGGTVFKVTPTGTLTTLYNFCTQTGCPDGEYPYAPLIQGADGNFYGTTSNGGANGNDGTAFKITPSGTLTTLYSFCTVQQAGQNPVVCLDGYYPIAGLVQASDGNIYGTTDLGGANCNPGGGCGTFFKIGPSGTLTTIYSFSDNAEGGPQAALIQATDGNLYGTTEGGGTNGNGAAFEITTSGTLTTLHAFSGADGANPEGAGIVQHTDGNFYGTANYGGSNPDCSCGTVFSLSVGLGPFVETVPTYGPSGTAVMILGTDLTGATSVSFNGTAATFTVASTSLITTTVPTGATTGPVTVITPSGTLTSNLPFTIAGARPTTTTLISSLNPSTFNQSVTFTATVTAADGGTPTGTVTFTADGSNVLGTVALSSGQAALSTSSLKAGTHSIVASYGGDSNYQPSASTALIQNVQMASSTLSIASNIDPSVYGQAVTFTIYVTPQFGGSATGGVTFYNNTTVIGTAGVSGNKATLTYSALTVGTAGIQATYSGDSNVAGSSSPVLFQVVTKASTTTAVASSLNPAFVGQTITFTATVTSQHQGMVSGTVDFKSGTLSLGSAALVNGQASIDASFSASGSHSVTAKYLGDVNNTGSTSPALKQIVNKYPSSTAVVSSLNPSTVGQTVTFTATVTVTTNGSPTGTVTFKSGTTVLGKVPLTGNIASLSTSALTAGTHSVKAVYSGDGTFKGSTSTTLKQVVKP